MTIISPAADQPNDRLLLSVPATAELLSISQRKLFDLTKPRGPIPCVMLGRRVLYSPDSLEEFIAKSELN